MEQILKKRLAATARFALVAAVLGGFIGYVMARIDDQPPPTVVASSACAGLILGAIIAWGEEFLVPGWSRRLSFARLNLTRFAFNAAAIFVIVVAANLVRLKIDYDLPPDMALAHFWSASGPRDLVVVVVVAVIVTSAFELRHLYTVGEIWHLLSGRYHYPVSEPRVVLFADLVGSTGLAEKLGPVRYSHFIRDLFADVAEPVMAWRGTVLQYAGDGFIVTWPRSKGLRDAACIRCFLDMSNTMLARGAYYSENYGAIPRLRGGIHVGNVVVTRVGETKSAMTYLGDVMNVAARLQAQCRDTDLDLLVSTEVYTGIDDPNPFDLQKVGVLSLRGRREDIEAYGLGVAPGQDFVAQQLLRR